MRRKKGSLFPSLLLFYLSFSIFSGACEQERTPVQANYSLQGFSFSSSREECLCGAETVLPSCPVELRIRFSTDPSTLKSLQGKNMSVRIQPSNPELSLPPISLLGVVEEDLIKLSFETHPQERFSSPPYRIPFLFQVAFPNGTTGEGSFYYAVPPTEPFPAIRCVYWIDGEKNPVPSWELSSLKVPQGGGVEFFYPVPSTLYVRFYLWEDDRLDPNDLLFSGFPSGLSEDGKKAWFFQVPEGGRDGALPDDCSYFFSVEVTLPSKEGVDRFSDQEVSPLYQKGCP